jgi:hypothetical protein
LLQYYVQKGLEAREAYERELQAWQRTLTPEDVKRENLFRAGQRKIGKSTATNLVSPPFRLARSPPFLDSHAVHRLLFGRCRRTPTHPPNP